VYFALAMTTWLQRMQPSLTFTVDQRVLRICCHSDACTGTGGLLGLVGENLEHGS